MYTIYPIHDLLFKCLRTQQRSCSGVFIWKKQKNGKKGEVERGNTLAWGKNPSIRAAKNIAFRASRWRRNAMNSVSVFSFLFIFLALLSMFSSQVLTLSSEFIRLLDGTMAALIFCGIFVHHHYRPRLIINF